MCVFLPNIDKGMRDLAGRLLPLARVSWYSQNWKAENDRTKQNQMQPLSGFVQQTVQNPERYSIYHDLKWENAANSHNREAGVSLVFLLDK